MSHETQQPSRDPESPTTVHPLNFEDDSVLEVASQPGGAGPAPAPGESSPKTEHPPPPPPKPARPPNPRQQQENTLKEAFPTLDAAVIRAVLTASAGNMERAFHALLGMTDPVAKEEETEQDDVPPPQPPRPSRADIERQRQLAADEQFARELAKHYESQNRRRQDTTQSSHPQQRKRGTDLKPNELYDDDHDFFRDDLPVIQDNLKKGFQDTQVKVNSFFSNLVKRFEGEESDDDEDHGGRKHYDEKGQQRPRSNYKRDFDGRYSDNHHRYDSDAKVLDAFSGLDLRDDEDSASRPQLPARPRHNNSPPLPLRKPGAPQRERRKVSFQEGPPEEITGPRSSPQQPQQLRRSSSLATKGRWQPLQPVDPSPVNDHDPFSLGDDDDDKTKDATTGDGHEDEKSDKKPEEDKEKKSDKKPEEDKEKKEEKGGKEEKSSSPKTKDSGDKGLKDPEETLVVKKGTEEDKDTKETDKADKKPIEEESAVD